MFHAHGATLLAFQASCLEFEVYPEGAAVVVPDALDLAVVPESAAGAADRAFWSFFSRARFSLTSIVGGSPDSSSTWLKAL